MIKSDQHLNYLVNLCGFQQASGTFKKKTAAKAAFSFMMLHQESPLALLDPDTLKGLYPSQQALSHSRQPQNPSTQVLGSTITWRCNEGAVFIDRVLLVKLPVPQLHFMEPYSSSPHSQQSLLSQINSLNTPPYSTPHHAVSYTYVVMSPYLHAGPSSGLLSRGFLTKFLCPFLFSSSYHSPPAALTGLQGPLCMDHNRVCVR